MHNTTIRDFAVRAFRAKLEIHGINVVELFERVILQRETAANTTQPDHSAPSIQEILEVAVTMSGDPALGVRMGQKLAMTEYGTYGFAIMSCINMGAALELFLRYGQTFIDGAHWSSTEYEDGLIVRLDQDSGTDHQKMLVTEAAFSSLHTFNQSLIARPVEGIRVHFNYPKPAHFTVYESSWSFPMEFDQEHCQIFLPRQWLNQRVRTGDPTTNVLFTQQCEEILQGMIEVKDVTAAVRRLLILSAGEFLSIKEVSDQLHITERTLRRRLAAEGTDFRTIFDNIRNTLAQNYLSNTSLSVVEISHLLGYGEATNFHRAFQRWNSMTPNEYRDHTALSSN